MVANYKKQGKVENKAKVVKNKKQLLSEMKKPLPDGKITKNKVCYFMPPLYLSTCGFILSVPVITTGCK